MKITKAKVGTQKVNCQVKGQLLIKQDHSESMIKNKRLVI